MGQIVKAGPDAWLRRETAIPSLENNAVAQYEIHALPFEVARGP